MKLKRILSAILAIMMLASAVIITPAIADDTTNEVISFDYSSLFRDISNGYKTVIVEKDVQFEGKNALKVTPNPNATDEATVTKGKGINLDSYNVIKGVDLTKVRYMTVEYYLDMETAPKDKMQMEIINNPGGTLLKSVCVNTNNAFVTGKWATAFFDLSILEEASNPDKPMLNHFHLRPYGYNIKYTNFKETDVCYIGKVSFYTERPDIPEANPDNADPEVIEFDYSSLFRDISNSHKTAITEKNVSFEGKNALKVIPNPNTTDEATVTKGKGINLDSYNVIKGVDLTKVRSMTVEYYLDMEKAPNDTMQMEIINNPGGTILKSVCVNTKDAFVTGKWATATFDLSILEEASNPDKPMLNHFHLRPYGFNTKYTNFKETDVCYIANISFSTESVAVEDEPADTPVEPTP